MAKENRFNYILEKLRDQHEVGFSELSRDLNVSEDTIRRDIDMLSTNGLLLKVRGGAIPRSHNPLTFKERIDNSRNDKAVIASKAQQLIKSGQTIFLDGGTSVYMLVSLLSTDIRLTVVTNSVAIIPALSLYQGIELIVLGGRYQKESEIMIGYDAVKMAENFQADLFFMGVCAVDAARGVTASFMEEAELKRTMLQHSGSAIALSTIDKIGTFESYRVCDSSELDYIVTENDPTDHRLNSLRDLAVKIL